MLKFFTTHSGTIEKLTTSTDPEVVKMVSHLKSIGKHVDGISKAHGVMGDHLAELNPKDEGDDAEKLAKAAAVTGGESDLAKAVAEQSKQIANLTAAFAKLIGSQPVVPAVAVNPQAVAKGADGKDVEVKIDPKDPEAAIKMMKGIHAGGPVLLKAHA